MPQTHLYKGKFLIALYDEEDWPLAVFDNCKQMSIDMKISYCDACSRINHYFKDKEKYMFYKNVRCRCYLIRFN